MKNEEPKVRRRQDIRMIREGINEQRQEIIEKINKTKSF